MFKEVRTLEDLKYVHFVVLIFRDADQCEKYCIYLDKMKLSTNKQYWALVTDVNKADEIHTKDGFYVSFKGDDNCYYEKIGNNEPIKIEDLPFDIPDN